jgi:thiol:disulfide interchange protein DsbD
MSRALLWGIPLACLALWGGIKILGPSNEAPGSLVSKGSVAEDVDWITDHDQGLEIASVEGRPILFDAWANWCSSCKSLWKNTFMDPRVQQRLKPYVRIKLDMDEKKNVSYWEQYSMNGGLPWVGFLTPEGVVLESFTLRDYEAPAAFLKRLDAVEGRSSESEGHDLK